MRRHSSIISIFRVNNVIGQFQLSGRQAYLWEST